MKCQAKRLMILLSCGILLLSHFPLSSLAAESLPAKFPPSESQSALQKAGVSADVIAGEPSDLTEVQEKIDHLTKNILLRLIKLERFNLHYRLEVAQQGRWKGWRYFLSQEGNASATQAGLIVGVSERMSNISTPRLVRPNVLQAGLVPQIVGQFTGASGSALEFAINVFQLRKAEKRGFSSRKAKQYVLGLREEIDSLLAERRSIIEKAYENRQLTWQVKLAESEGRVLKDIRDLTLLEFVNFHSGTRRFLAFQQSLYLLDIAKNVTGAVGNIVAYSAIAQRDRRINAPAGICTTVSGALIMTAPILSRATGIAYGALDKRRVKECVKDCQSDALSKLALHRQEMQDRVNQLLAENKQQGKLDSLDESLVNRMAVYDAHNNVFLTHLQQSTKAARAGTLAATENILSGLFVGGTKVANGVCFTVAGYKYPDDARMTNILIGSGSVTYMAGTAWSMLDNLRLQAKREWTDRKLAGKHLLAQDLIKTRLERLDEMEAALAGSGTLVSTKKDQVM